MPDLTPMTRQEKFLNGDTDLEPITRREHFYAGRESKLPEGHQEPETREEWFIKEYRGGGGGDITVESLSVTSNGTYTAPSGKAYSPVNVNVPLPENTYLLKSVANLPQAIASFNDGQDMVMPSLKVAIEPQQDLHGYDAPWVGGAGKNKLPSINQTQTINGVTWTLQSDGSIKLSGTATANSVYDFGRSDNLTLKSGSYFANENGTNFTVTIFRVVGGSASAYKSGGGAFSISEDTEIFMRVTVPSGTSVNETLYPMIESGSARTSYAPYSNICPISGWSEADVGVAGKNLFDKATNVLNGYMTSDGTFKASNSGEKTFYCKVPKGTITMGKPVGTSMLRGVLFDEIPSNNAVGYTVLQYESNAKQTFTTTKETYYVCYCYNNTGETNTWQAVLDSIQVEIGDTPTTYEPYNGSTYTIDLGGTRYGGELDVVSGIFTPAPYYASYNGEALTGEWISDRDKYEVGTTPTIGAQVVNIGASGTPVSILPTAIKSIRGQNNVYANTGDIKDAEYFSKEV